MSVFLVAGALGFAAFVAEPPRAIARFPVTVNDVRDADDIQVSVEFSMRVQVLDAPETKREMLQRTRNPHVMLEVPLYDDLSKSIGPNGIRARVRKDRE